jgi:hypothetical protein
MPKWILKNKIIIQHPSAEPRKLGNAVVQRWIPFDLKID